jgi:hypothetical protein
VKRGNLPSLAVTYYSHILPPRLLIPEPMPTPMANPIAMPMTMLSMNMPMTTPMTSPIEIPPTDVAVAVIVVVFGHASPSSKPIALLSCSSASWRWVSLRFI